MVLCSVRDIVQEKPKHRMQETVETIGQYFDKIMVHGDPDFIRFEDSFSCIGQIEHLLHYTGFVSQFPLKPSGAAGEGEVLISSGGGAVSSEILEVALEAHRVSRLEAATWRFLIGPNTPEPTIKRLQRSGSRSVIIEPNRDDFLTLLSNCKVTVSQAGYNTIADILLTGARAVVVPFEGDGETEQKQRSQKLQQYGAAYMVSESRLSAAALAEAIDRCAAHPPNCTKSFDLNGATASARFVQESWRLHAGRKVQS